MHRRDFHRRVAAATFSCTAWRPLLSLADESLSSKTRQSIPIIDTHQHLWDLQRQKVPWLENAPEVLRKSYVTRDYLEATKGLNVVKAIYMEVDLAPADHLAEVDLITRLCKSPDHPTVAAVVGGRPGSDGFADYAQTIARNPHVKGVRQVLHGATPPGYCLSDQFVSSMRLLGELGLSFDLCLRTDELSDAVKLVDQCRDTRFIVDHCGNADPKALLPASRRDGAKPSHDPDAWRKAITELGQRQHVVCKISGVVARAPSPTGTPRIWHPSSITASTHSGRIAWCLAATGLSAGWGPNWRIGSRHCRKSSTAGR